MPAPFPLADTQSNGAEVREGASLAHLGPQEIVRSCCIIKLTEKAAAARVEDELRQSVSG